MEYWAARNVGLLALCCVCLVGLTKQVGIKETDTYGCFSNDPGCGQHKMACPEGQVVIITNARYAHLPRSTSCSRGKVSACSSRYLNSCCRPSGNECFGAYKEDDANPLLRPCLGSRSCSHMTPQTHRKCGNYKLSKSTFSAVTHRCVPNERIISYATEDQVTNDLVYLFYQTPIEEPLSGTANVYGCDISGPDGAKVKVKAIDVGMHPAEGRSCSSLEIDKKGDVTGFSCERNDLRFLSVLFDGSVPVNINIVDVSESPPQEAWVLVEGSGNMTVECGKVRGTRKVKVPTTVSSYVSTATSPAAVVAPSASTPQSTQTTSMTTSTSIKDRTTISEPGNDSVTTIKDGYGPKGRPKSEPTPDPSSSSTAASTSVPPVTSSDVPGYENTMPLETAVAVASLSGQDRVLTYGGIAGSLLLLIILIIIITVICYRRKRYRRYQSRKIEEERNIPDGEERSNDKADEERRKCTEDTCPDRKGDNSSYDSPLPDSKNSKSSGPIRVKGRKERGQEVLSGGVTSPPRVSQPRDSDGYTNAGKPYGNDDASRDVTVEFYDNPGFKTTLENIKLPK